ncbi:MAG: cytosine permease [Bacteroidota bacterium]
MQQEQEQANGLSIASIWLGGMVSIPSLLIGSTLIVGMNFVNTLIAGLLGIAFVTAFMSLESIAAVDRRLNTVQLARSAFGSMGASILIGGIIGLATMGWFGVQTNIAGISFSKILSDTFEIEVAVALSSAFWGAVMLLTAVYGFRLMKWLNYIAVPAILLLMFYGLYISFQGKGWDGILSYEAETELSFLSAIGLAIGFVSVGGVISPDINRFAKSRKAAIWGSVLGLIPAGMLLLAVGAILAILQGTHDITEIFSQLGYPVLALSILILATWTTNVINAYSGGLALNQLFSFTEESRAKSTLIAGAIGTLLALMGILNYFIGFLSLLTTAIPPIAGVIIADYFLTKSFEEHREEKLRWQGFLAWAVGVGSILFMEDAVKNLLGIFIAATCYYLFDKIPKKEEDKNHEYSAT